MLKFRAIHLDHGPGVAKQNLRRRLHNACLSGPSRSEKQQVPHRPPGRIQSRAKHLIQIDERLHALVLSHDLGAQRRLEFQRVCAALIWIKWQDVFSHGRPPSVSATAETPFRIELARAQTAPVSPAAWTAADVTAQAVPSPQRAIPKFGVSAETSPPNPGLSRANLRSAFAPPANSGWPSPPARLPVPGWFANSVRQKDASWTLPEQPVP